jgi:hypothetical protein
MEESKEVSSKSRDSGFFLFVGADEKIVYEAPGILSNIIQGKLVLTDKKLFFYFISNISRDKEFIASYPYIVSAELKEGIFNSTLIIRNKKETFEITKINKKSARDFHKILNDIIQQNKTN